MNKKVFRREKHWLFLSLDPAVLAAQTVSAQPYIEEIVIRQSKNSSCFDIIKKKFKYFQKDLVLGE